LINFKILKIYVFSLESPITNNIFATMLLEIGVLKFYTPGSINERKIGANVSAFAGVANQA
jgi:hypothetical protein